MTDPHQPDRPGGPIADHRRQWRDCLYVYPVVSRRAGGVSIGVNLNPDRKCNFGCVYCQIDRSRPRGLREVDLDTVAAELAQALSAAISGELWNEPRFADTPAPLRHVNDIAFSGDGEPTCLEEFDQAVRIAADAKAQAGLDEVKIVVITNASLLDSPQVRRALHVLDENNGEIWAKLDAGTEEYFRLINRPRPGLTLEEIIRNIQAVGMLRPIVIQTLLCKLDGQSMDEPELQAYCKRLRTMLANGTRIQQVQLHTVAREPATGQPVTPLTDDELKAMAKRIIAAVPGVEFQVFGQTGRLG